MTAYEQTVKEYQEAALLLQEQMQYVLEICSKLLDQASEASK